MGYVSDIKSEVELSQMVNENIAFMSCASTLGVIAAFDAIILAAMRVSQGTVSAHPSRRRAGKGV